jgi:hypothetical protein
MSGVQSGGVQRPVVDEIIQMTGHFSLLFLVLVCVYVSRIPSNILYKFKKTWVQLLGVLGIMTITALYGYIHGILAALAFSLVVSHALRSGSEGFTGSCDSPVLILDNDSASFVPKSHRWFSEKVLGENPIAINEDRVTTSAVQDLSERTMGTNSSNVSR